jgi:hypothetical protein
MYTFAFSSQESVIYKLKGQRFLFTKGNIKISGHGDAQAAITPRVTTSVPRPRHLGPVVPLH